MCRYAFKDYKSHFACFSCQKAFKKISYADWTKQQDLDYAIKRLRAASQDWIRQEREEELGTSIAEIQKRYLDEVSPCPECSAPMAAMGLDFKAPKQSANEEWQIIEALYDHGFAFRGCGCMVYYKPPKKLSELEAFFREHGRLSEGQKLLERIGKKSGS